MTDFNAAYLATRQDRNRAEMDKALAEVDATIAAQQPKPSAAPAQAPTPAPKKEASPGVMQETKRAVLGGVQDAVYNVTHMADEAAGWLNENFLHLKSEAPTRFVRAGSKEAEATTLAGNLSGKSTLGTVKEPESTAGKLARGLVSYATTFTGTALATGGLGGGLVTNMARGAAADFAGQDPTQGNLSNLIMDVSKGDPIVGKQLFSMLSIDPNDNAAWNRSKNVLEGAGLGTLAEGVTRVFKATVGKVKARGGDPVAELMGPPNRTMDQLAAEPAFGRTGADHSIPPTTAQKAPDLTLADQINVLTGVKRDTPSKFQKAADMKAALAEADKAKPLDFSPSGAPAKAPTEPSLVPKDAVSYESKGVASTDTPSAPEAWKLVEEDPTPRKAFMDPQDGHIVMAKEAQAPHQLDLDLHLPEVIKKEARTAEDDAMLQGYKDLQEQVLKQVSKDAPEEAAAASKGATDLDSRIAKAQARVDALMESGGDSATAQKLLDSLLKKKDAGLFDHATSLTGKQADQLATAGDPVVDALAANNEKLLKAFGKQQGGFISPSMLANLASMQAGAVTGFMSAEDDATFAERMGLAGLGALAGYGVKVGASKVLKPAERAALDSPHPVAQALARKESAGIAPMTEAMAAKRPAPIIHMSKVKELAQAAKEGRLGEVAKGASKDSINFDRIDTDDDVKELFNAVQSTFDKEFGEARGGAVRTHEEVAVNADLVGTSLKSLEDHYQQFANMDSKMLADRHLLVASAEKVRDLIKAATESGDDFTMLALEKQIKLHAVIQAKVKGMASEAARALSAMRIHANSADLAINEAHQMLESMGGKVAKLDYYKQLMDIPTDGGFNKAIRMGAMATTKDALTEATVMAKLWAPTTHAANLVGNLITATLGPVEKVTASLIGKYITKSADAIEMAEAKSQMFGMIGGLQDALQITSQGLDAAKQAAGAALKGDFKGAKGVLEDNMEEFGTVYRSAALDSPIGRSTLDSTMDAGSRNPAISAEAFNLDKESPMGILADVFGTLNRLPGRALGASDELFWSINYRGEARAQAYRQARLEGLEGQEFIERVSHYIENPTADMRVAAVEAAQKGTFTEPLSGFGKWLQEGVDNTLSFGPIPVGRLFVPFVKTPYNIMKYFAERTPLLNMATDSWKADMKAGGARRDMALARLTTGSTLLGLAGIMGAPTDIGGVTVQVVGGGDQKQGAEKLNGEQQYSLKIGDTSYSFSRLAPLGMWLGLGADIRSIAGSVPDSTLDEIAATSALAFSRNITSQSMLSGVLDFIAASQKAVATQDVEPLRKYLNNQAAGAIPFQSLANTVRKEEDPLAREVWSLVDAVKNKVPGLSKDLLPQRNLFGEPVHNPEGLGPDWLSPIRTSQSDTDPLATEIARLNVDLKRPSRTLIAAPGAPGVDLTPKQYDELCRTTGELFKTALGKETSTDRYKDLPENPGNKDYREAKETVIRRIFSQSQRAAQQRLLSSDKELRDKYLGTKRNAHNALAGRPLLPL